MNSFVRFAVVACCSLSGCVGAYAAGTAGYASGGALEPAPELDLKDSLVSPRRPAYPSLSKGEALYRRMLRLEPMEVMELSLLLPRPDRDSVVDHILKTKGKEAYWSWKFQIHAGLPSKEREFVDWYLRAYTSYRPVPPAL